MEVACVSKESFGESTTFNEDEFVIPEPYTVIDELIEDAIWDVCFEVHRAAQHGIILDDIEQQNSAVDVPETDSSGRKLKRQSLILTCPICNLKSGATKYTKHLSKCLGNKGRLSSRAAATKITVTYESEEDDEEIERSKKPKKNKGRRSKFPKGQSSPKPTLTLKDIKEMSSEKREEYFNTFCGSISKKGKTMCKNTRKCTLHKDVDRKSLRILLGDSGEEQTANDEQIDVDTVDDVMWKNQWI